MGRRFLLDESDIAAIRRDINALRNAGGLNTGNGAVSVGTRRNHFYSPPSPPALRPLFATITAIDYTTGEFTATQTDAYGTTLTNGMTFDGTDQPKLTALSGAKWHPPAVVRVYRALDDNGDPAWVCEGFPRDQLIRVNLSQTGGSDGDNTSAPTYTYTVTTRDGTQLLTGASPELARPSGAVFPATFGEAYFNDDGDAVLWRAHEMPETVECD